MLFPLLSSGRWSVACLLSGCWSAEQAIVALLNAERRDTICWWVPDVSRLLFIKCYRRTSFERRLIPLGDGTANLHRVMSSLRHFGVATRILATLPILLNRWQWFFDRYWPHLYHLPTKCHTNRYHVLHEAMGHQICQLLGHHFELWGYFSPSLSATSIVIWPQLQLIISFSMLSALQTSTGGDVFKWDCKFEVLLPFTITVFGKENKLLGLRS